MNYFSQEMVETMQAIFKRLEPQTLESVQLHSIDNKNRVARTIVVQNKYKKIVFVYQNFTHLSKYRLGILKKEAQKIPYPLHTTINDGLVCVGWKIV